jgi:phosphoribosylaminoimidazole-succinocarboxamide synthase
LNGHADEADLHQVCEGKTKIIYEIATAPTAVLIRSKDRITAFDGKRADEFEGKSSLSNMTSSKVFEYLTECGVCARAHTRIA